MPFVKGCPQGGPVRSQEPLQFQPQAPMKSILDVLIRWVVGQEIRGRFPLMVPVLKASHARKRVHRLVQMMNHIVQLFLVQLVHGTFFGT